MAAEGDPEPPERLSRTFGLCWPLSEGYSMDQEHRRKQPNVCLVWDETSNLFRLVKSLKASTSPSRKTKLCQLSFVKLLQSRETKI